MSKAGRRRARRFEQTADVRKHRRLLPARWALVAATRRKPVDLRRAAAPSGRSGADRGRIPPVIAPNDRISTACLFPSFLVGPVQHASQVLNDG